jgi:hypothetical protein
MFGVMVYHSNFFELNLFYMVNICPSDIGIEMGCLANQYVNALHPHASTTAR